MESTYITRSIDETIDLGRKIGLALLPGSVICLEGDLGAGKTTLVKGIAEGYCRALPNSVVSPTFVLLNIYSSSSEENKKLYHFDLYRLSGIDEFLALGFEEFFYKDGISCIEWCERISEILPPSKVTVNIQALNENERLIAVSNL